MKTLNELIYQNKIKSQASRFNNVRQLEALIKSYNGLDWRQHLKTENGKPANTVLLQNEQVKVILIFWEAGQRSKKHGHAEGGGLIKPLTGILKEIRFDPNNTDHIIAEHIYTPGQQSYIHDSIAYHIVENPGLVPAVSLHVYASGISTTKEIELNNYSMIEKPEGKVAA